MEFGLQDLKQIMRECAGEDDSVDLDAAGADTPLEDLGYDSLAVLETAGRLQRELGIEIPEQELAAVDTPGALVELVGRQLDSTV